MEHWPVVDTQSDLITILTPTFLTLSNAHTWPYSGQ